ncbi:MAG TPA: BON domain-containing protein [Gemmatimonas sp.]
MQNRRRPARQGKTGRIVLVALGAVAGLAIGMVLADRLGGLEALKRAPSRRRHRQNGWRADQHRSESFDEMPDDHSELAPEAISHLHLAEHFIDQAPRRAESRREETQRSSRRGKLGLSSSATAAGETAPSLDELEERVLEAFQNDPMLAHRSIDIGAVAPGEVELTGWVAAPAEIDYALTIARGVPGVERVLNSLAANADAVD